MTMRQWGGGAAVAMLVALGPAARSVVAQESPEWPQFRGLAAGDRRR